MVRTHRSHGHMRGFGKRHQREVRPRRHYYTLGYRRFEQVPWHRKPLQSPQRDVLMSSEIRANVRLSGAIEVRGTVQFFAVDVFPGNGGAPWRVMRRYNHFLDLASKLGARNIPARFPRKHWSECEGSQLERRRQGLETWLSRAIASSREGNQHWIPFLRCFLERSAYCAPKFDLQMLSPVPHAEIPGQNLAELPLPIDVEHAIDPLSQPAQESLGSSSKPLVQVYRQAEQTTQLEMQSNASDGQLSHTVVPHWRSLSKAVQLRMPQLHKICMSAMTASKALEMLD